MSSGWKEIPSLEGEEWKTAKFLFPKIGVMFNLVGWKGSNKGRLRNKWKLLSDKTKDIKGHVYNNYRRIKENILYQDLYRHRIVLSTFVENPDWRVYVQGDHIDPYKVDDNSLENLRWSTRKMNDANRKCKARSHRRKWRYCDADTKKHTSFNTKEECEAAIKVYHHKRWKKASAEAILDCIILKALVSRTV